MKGVMVTVSQLGYKIPEEIFNQLKPHLNGMFLGDIHILLNHIENDTFTEMKEWADRTVNMQYKVFFTIVQNVLMDYMEA